MPIGLGYCRTQETVIRKVGQLWRAFNGASIMQRATEATLRRWGITTSDLLDLDEGFIPIVRRDVNSGGDG